MTHVEAKAGQTKLLAWDRRLTVRIAQVSATDSVVTVNHSSYANRVVIAEAYEVDLWIAGSPILSHADPFAGV